MKASQLRGYLLEEALAYLIRTAGYKLITRPEVGMRNSGAGLQIKGRGGWHQADVLGRLEMIPAFTFPMRLFTEAKFYDSKPVGINVVRNAVGTITDLNGALVLTEDNLPVSYNYRYEYALFSASGFNKEAANMALAYGISLIDLSTDEYTPLLESISNTASRISSRFNNSGHLKQIRNTLRRSLETASHGHELSQDLLAELEELVRVIRSYNRLYLGTINAPFMLLLKADNPTNFERFSEQQEGHDHYVDMHWSQNNEKGRKWTIQPESGSEYTLSFKIPNEIHNWIFNKEATESQRALQAKRSYFSEISIYLSRPSLDKVIKLKLSQNLMIDQ